MYPKLLKLAYMLKIDVAWFLENVGIEDILKIVG